jgi:hypothetical protein
MRAAEELRSALIFRALAQAGHLVGLPDAWLDRFRSAMHDEIGHAKLCADVGARLGARRPCYDARPVRSRLASLVEPMHRATALLLVEVAMGETISMFLFRAGRRNAVEPCTRTALSAILLDEVRHQRLGWKGIAAIWSSLSARQQEALQAQATIGFASFEQQIAVPALRRLETGESFDPAYAAVEWLVVPRLTRLGLDGKRAWDGRYKPACV